jgi:hypothetical protein
MARSFNGTTDKIVVGTIGMPTTTPVTIAAWAFITTGSRTNPIFFSSTNQTGSAALQVSSANKVALDKQDLLNLVTSSGTVSTNTWTFVAGTFDNGGTNVATAYINSTATTNTPGAQTLVNTPMALGFDSPDGLYFAGDLADVAVWNVALTQTEISALSQGIRPYQIRPSALIGGWPLDGLESAEPDLSGKRNNGALTGTASVFGPPYAPFTPRWPQFWFPSPPPQITISYQRRQQILMTGP